MKKFMEITTHLPFITEYGERPATVMVKSHMGGQVTITFAEGSPQGKELHKLLCNEQIDSFHMSVTEYANANGEVVETGRDVLCPNHNPVQHRDGKEPWCHECKLNAKFQEPYSSFVRPPRLGESLRKYEDETGVPAVQDSQGRVAVAPVVPGGKPEQLR